MSFVFRTKVLYLNELNKLSEVNHKQNANMLTIALVKCVT